MVEAIENGKVSGPSDLINVNVLFVARAVAVLVKLKVAVVATLVAICVRLVDLGVLGQFAVRLETSGLVGRVLQDDVAFLVLVVPQREQDDVTLVDPHLLAQLAPDMREALLAVETLRLKSTISKHLDYLSVLLAILLEGKFSLLVVIFVLPSSSIFTSLRRLRISDGIPATIYDDIMADG